MSKVLFEIFGCYYKVVTEIVNKAPLTKEEVIRIINDNGFSESCLHLLPKIKELPFIEFKEGKYYSKLENKIKLPITNLEKSWLKSISKESCFKLFSDEIDEKLLADVEPLYDQAIFKFYDKYSDGDDVQNEFYRKHFRKINTAMDNKTVVKIIYQSPKRNHVTVAHYLPLKFEFSPKDDKFRFFAARVRNGRIVDYVYLNMGRVLGVRKSTETFDKNIALDSDSINLQVNSFTPPIVVEVYDDRNAIERFMIEFSAYQKQSEFDEERNLCTTKIYYRKSDEIEVLIKLLSFGPTLKVLGPERFLKKFEYRIQKQYELIKK